MAITITDTGDGGLSYTAPDGTTQTLTWDDVDAMYARKPTWTSTEPPPPAYDSPGEAAP